MANDPQAPETFQIAFLTMVNIDKDLDNENFIMAYTLETGQVYTAKISLSMAEVILLLNIRVKINLAMEFE